MKQLTIIALILIVSITARAQTKLPKQHVFHDTVKTIQERIDYAPDTIAVWFKELRTITTGGDSLLVEQWKHGYVIWQTYHKGNDTLISNGGQIQYGAHSWGLYTLNATSFYKTDFEQSIRVIAGDFLYSDRKTRVTNRVIQTIKQ